MSIKIFLILVNRRAISRESSANVIRQGQQEAGESENFDNNQSEMYTILALPSQMTLTKKRKTKSTKVEKMIE